MRRGLMKWLPEEMPAVALDERIARLQAAMAGAGLEAVLAYTSFAQPAAVHWLTHFTPYWSEALLVVPATGRPVLLAALTPRVHAWIREVSHIGEVVSAPRPGAAAAAWLAQHAPAGASVGVVGLDVLPWSVAEPLLQALGPKRLVDAGAVFRQARQPADAAERALAARAGRIAASALCAIPAQVRSASELAAAADGSARRAGAEEVLLRVAPDLARDGTLLRLEGERPLGACYAVELSVAYKGVWVRLARSFANGPEPAEWIRARAWFDAALSDTPSLAALAAGRLAAPAGHAARWTVESCIGLQPLSVVAASEPGFPCAPPLPAGALCTLSVGLAGAGGHWIASAPLAVLPHGLQQLTAATSWNLPETQRMTMPIFSRRVALGAALALALPLAALAQDYPSKPIKIVVPVPAGGAADTLARIIGDRLTAKFGQPVIVENRVGANGNIGADFVAHSPPDGYTLLLSPPGPLAINKSLYKKMSYDSDALVPVSVVAANPNVLLVHPSVPAKTLQELIAYAKANPGKLNYASSGSGSTTHLAGELLKQKAGIEATHVPYKGGPPAYRDLMAGQVHIMFQGLATAMPQIREGSVRALAVGSDKRHPAVPDVPTLAETFPGFVTVSWTGLAAPPNTPPAIVQKLQAAIAETLKNPEATQGVKGLDVRDLVVSTPAEAAKFFNEEKQRWGAIIRASGVSVD